MSNLTRSLRLEQGWSQEQLAEIAGVSTRTVQRLENGEACSLETAKALAAAFDTRAEMFLAPQTEVVQPAEDDEALLRQIRLERKVRAQFAFYKHLVSYIVFHVLLAAINLITSPGHLWFLYSMLGWGIGVASHAFSVFHPAWETRMVERMIEREENRRA